MIRLGIGLPAYGSKLDVGHAAMWLGLGAALCEARDKFTLTWFSEYHVNGIDLCRNTIVYDAMVAGCDWVFMIDADTFHRSTGTDGIADAIGDAGVDILQMIRDADRRQVPVDTEDGFVSHAIELPAGCNGVGLVGAPVRGRGGETQDVCVQDTSGQLVPLRDLRGTVRAVGRIGGACIAVNLGWIRRFWPTGPWFVMTHDYTSRPRNARGEDYAICDGIRERGGAVLCDGRFVPSHVDRRRLVGES
jgi:hypothetical protein